MFQVASPWDWLSTLCEMGSPELMLHSTSQGAHYDWCSGSFVRRHKGPLIAFRIWHSQGYCRVADHHPESCCAGSHMQPVKVYRIYDGEMPPGLQLEAQDKLSLMTDDRKKKK